MSSAPADAGYSGKPLWQKLGLSAGQRVQAIDPPRDYGELTGFDLSTLATSTLAKSSRAGLLDLVHLFVRDRAALERQLAACIARLDMGGTCWVSWPKKSSPLFRDLTEDGVREVALPLGWVDVKVCAVDADWSGLKLLRRRR